MQGNPLSDSLSEKSSVSYQVVITGIPSQTTTLELSTDLIPADPSVSLWTISTDGVTTADSLNERLIRLTAAGGFPVSVTIDVNGRVPTITTKNTVDDIVITKISNQRSRLYYDIKALDSQGKSLSAAATGTLTVTVKDEEEFLDRANAVDDTAFRNLVTGMYAKGLTEEAKAVLDWYEDNSPMPVFVPVIVGVIALVIGLVAGFVLGMKFAYRRNYDEN